MAGGIEPLAACSQPPTVAKLASSGNAAASTEAGSLAERTRALERTWESEVAMIGEFGLARPR